MRSLLLFVFLAGPFTGAAAAQSATDVHVPAIEFCSALSYDVRRDGTADQPGGAGAIVALVRNVNEHLALAAQLSGSPRVGAAMAGGRISTGFFREGAGLPGRFFAEALAGGGRGQVSGDGAVLQLGAGADALVVRRGVSLHWAIDYLFMPHARTDFAGARVSVGFVVGPRIK